MNLINICEAVSRMISRNKVDANTNTICNRTAQTELIL